MGQMNEKQRAKLLTSFSYKYTMPIDQPPCGLA